MPNYPSPRIRDLRVRRVWPTQTTIASRFEIASTFPPAHSPSERNAGSDFIEIVTDGGAVGRFGPVTDLQSFIALRYIAPKAIGRPLLESQALLSECRSSYRFADSAEMLRAIAAVDWAVWDLRARLTGIPVWALLGRRKRTSVPAYASLLGYEIDSDAACELAGEVAKRGFVGQKWRLPEGPASGKAGLRRNYERIARIRSAVGRAHLLMVDARASWTPQYTIALASLIDPLGVLWIEEPLAPLDFLGIGRIVARSHVPIATGEHLYGSLEFRQLLALSRVRWIQPDAAWCGGILEAKRILHLAKRFGASVAFHGAGLLPALHLAVVHDRALVPFLEYHISLEPHRQRLFRVGITAENGHLDSPILPGLGVDLDDTQIARECMLYATDNYASP